MTLKALALVLFLSLSACAGGAPLVPDDDVAPPSCAAPDPAVAPSVAPDAAVASAADAGAGPSHPGIGLWMATGFVRDVRAAGLGGKDPAGDDFEIGTLFVGYVSYGMDVVTLNEGGRLASSFDIDFSGPPTSLIVEGDEALADAPNVPRTGNWLANVVYAGMTNVVETTSGYTTIRESPGGRIHCERSHASQTLACAFRGVVRADFH